jgi:hypothetical protein
VPSSTPLKLTAMKARLVPGSFGLLMSVLLLANILTFHPTKPIDMTSLRFLAFSLIAAGLWLAYRSTKCGHLELTDTQIKVRTLFRSRAFQLRDVQSIRAQTFSQYTLRVMPVLFFRDGSTYKLSEFFMQKRSYERTKPNNLVDSVVSTVTRAANTVTP